MTHPSDPLQSIVTDIGPNTAALQSTAKYYLFGHVRTDVPGYREIQIDDRLIRLPPATYRWDDLLGTLDAALQSEVGWYLTGYERDPWRLGLQSGAAATITFPDRLGWLLGFGCEARTSLPPAARVEASFAAPGGFPLYGAVWTEVQIDRELVTSIDNQRRAGGYVWGGARLHRFRLTMHRLSFEALRAGWLRAGRIDIVPLGNNATPQAPDEPGGFVSGYLVTVEGMRWLDPGTQRIAEVTLLLANTIEDF